MLSATTLSLPSQGQDGTSLLRFSGDPLGLLPFLASLFPHICSLAKLLCPVAEPTLGR